MKLAKVLLRERVPELGTSSFNLPHWDMTFEGGLLTLVKDGEAYLVPVASVLMMRPLEAPKGAKK